MRDQALTLVLARKVTIIILVSQWHEIDFTMWNSQIHGHGVLGAAGSIWGPRANEESSLGTQVWKYKSTSYSYNCSPNEWSNTQHLFYLLCPWGVSKILGSEDILKSILYHRKLKYWLLLCMPKCQSLVSHLMVPIFQNFFSSYSEQQSVRTGGPRNSWFFSSTIFVNFLIF